MAKYKKKAEVIRPTQNVLPPNFKGTDEQEAIANFVATNDGNLIVAASAGTGKTTTGGYLIDQVDRSKKIVAIAFNNRNVDTFKERLADYVDCSTAHSFGLNTIRDTWGWRDKNGKFDLDNFKYKNLAEKFGKDSLSLAGDELESFSYETAKTCDLVRSCIVDVDNDVAYKAIIERYGLNPSESTRKAVAYAIKEGNRLAQEEKKIDFEDMIYLPYAFGMQPAQYDFLFDDECQDNSPAQTDLLLKAVKDGGRSVWVGDDKQSMYAFRGAAPDSIEQIQRRVNPMVLPLSETFRCPMVHVDAINQRYPEIAFRANENNRQGAIIDIGDWEIPQLAQSGDLIICRNNAPLIPVAFGLIREGKHAKILGKEIGDNIIKPLRKIRKRVDYAYYRLERLVREEYDNEYNKLQKERRGKTAFANLGDKYECLKVCLEIYYHSCDTMDDLISKIQSLFSQNNAPITLMTIHKAKGGEGENIFLLNEAKLPHKWEGQQGWEFQQEKNIDYVGRTRSLDKLYQCNPV